MKNKVQTYIIFWKAHWATCGSSNLCMQLASHSLATPDLYELLFY